MCHWTKTKWISFRQIILSYTDTVTLGFSFLPLAPTCYFFYLMDLFDSTFLFLYYNIQRIQWLLRIKQRMKTKLSSTQLKMIVSTSFNLIFHSWTPAIIFSPVAMPLVHCSFGLKKIQSYTETNKYPLVWY